MKIACQSCGAKYTIADEKVSGKTVKIKCKKCGATVVVDGNAHGGAPLGDAADGMAGSSAEEWTVSVADDDQRTLSTDQIVAEFQNGIVTPETFVWREGMAEWQALAEVPELAARCGLAVGAAPEPPTQAMGSPAGLFGGGAAAAPMAASPAPAAARTKGRAQVDLFGGGAAPAPEAAPAGAHIGERNENSVLFSLSALTAAETAAKKAPTKPKASLDMGGGGKSSIDDIMNLGGGSLASGGSLAPPPVNAPFVEPPPPPPSFQAPVAAGPASMPGSMGSMGMPMPMPMEQPKKPPIGLIVGGILGVLVLAGGAFLLGRGGGDDAKEVAKNDTTAKPAAEDPPKKEEPKKEEEPKPAETAAPADTGATAEAAPATTGNAPASGPTTGGATQGKAPAGGAAPTSGKKEEPKKEEPKKEEKKEEPAAGGGTGSFDRGAAQAALGAAAGGAKGCKKPDGPTGSTKVQVTFAPSGRVTTVNVGPPFAGTPVGSCIAGAFKGASVPPFSGSPVTVSKTVSIK